MSRSKSLVIVFSSLCALAACARIPAPSTSRQPAQRHVVQEPMGNPSATERVRSTVEAPMANQLMEPDFDSEPSQASDSYDRALIENLEDPSAAAAPTPEARPPNHDEIIGPRSRWAR